MSFRTLLLYSYIRQFTIKLSYEIQRVQDVSLPYIVFLQINRLGRVCEDGTESNKKTKMIKRRLVLMKKKIMYLGVFAALFVAAMGMTAFAASNGPLVGVMYQGNARATITNNEATTRYCYVNLYQSSYSDGSNLSLLSAKNGQVSSGKYLRASGKPSRSYLYARAAKYKGSSQQSGVAKTYSVSFRK